MEKQLLTDYQVAIVIGLRPSQVRRMVQHGQLPARLLPNGEKRIDAGDLRDWVSMLKRTTELAIV